MMSVEQAVADGSNKAQSRHLSFYRQVMIELASLLEYAQQALHQDARLAGRYISNAAALLRSDRDFSKQDGTDIVHGRLAPWQLRRVKEFVRNELSNVVRVKDLAAAARLSTSHFSRAFSQTAGESPSRYLRRCRLEQAQKLMLSTDKSLAEIALECGYADQSHLSRCFRSIVGVTPKHWRRMRREDTGPCSFPGSEDAQPRGNGLSDQAELGLTMR